jgi:hypothetical protein
LAVPDARARARSALPPDVAAGTIPLKWPGPLADAGPAATSGAERTIAASASNGKRRDVSAARRTGFCFVVFVLLRFKSGPVATRPWRLNPVFTNYKLIGGGARFSSAAAGRCGSSAPVPA